MQDYKCVSFCLTFALVVSFEGVERECGSVVLSVGESERERVCMCACLYESVVGHVWCGEQTYRAHGEVTAIFLVVHHLYTQSSCVGLKVHAMPMWQNH